MIHFKFHNHHFQRVLRFDNQDLHCNKIRFLCAQWYSITCICSVSEWGYISCTRLQVLRSQQGRKVYKIEIISYGRPPTPDCESMWEKQGQTSPTLLITHLLSLKSTNHPKDICEPYDKRIKVCAAAEAMRSAFATGLVVFIQRNNLTVPTQDRDPGLAPALIGQ